MWFWYCWLAGCCWWWLSFSRGIEGFNVETDHYAIYRGSVQSMFGFSVAEYRDQNHRGWVIVGAPLNETNQVGVQKGGAVFRCDIAEDDRCFPVEFDKKGLDYVRSTKSATGVEPIDDKSYQWFGATISTSMTDGGPLLACAPKYHWFGYIKANWSVAGFKDVVGACWLTTLTGVSSNEYSPCRNNDTAGHHRQGMCQAGVGAAITKDGKRLFIGAPGSWYWQGQLFTIESNVTLPFVPVKDPHSVAGKEGFTSSYEQLRLLATKEGPASEDNSYLGYSVAVGDFLGNGDSGVAVGVPRGADLRGKVLLFTSQLLNHQNITGEQMGAYFGYAVAINDIDGDDRDDLIVTAPFYTQPEFAGVKIETGRIYVFYQKGGDTPYQKFDTRDGESNRGQFGLSVASLGDIDLDGYGDFVIGEPYGGPENRGAIYIYHGSSDGVEEKYSQVIYSENLEQPVRTFGWSVSGGLDLDGNNYPDLVVGAHESNSAIFFRARPVMTMYSEISFLSDSINLKNKACVLSDGTAVSCSELKICCMFTGLKSKAQHDFNVYISLDDKKKNNPRLFFLDYENKNSLNLTVSIANDELHCRQVKVYVAQHLRDKLTTLDAEIQIQLIKDNSKSSGNWRKRDPRKRLTAILGPKNTKKRDSLIIQKNCGSDNICVPDLSMRVNKNVEKYLLGSGKIVELEVSIQNNAEDAFESTFYLELPTGIDYVNIESLNESTEIIIQCTAPKSSNNNTLRCDVGNPLPEGKLVKFKVFLQPITFHGMKPSYEFKMHVNSTNPERDNSLWNNAVSVSLPVWIATDLFIEGVSKPQEIDFNSVDYTSTELDLLINTLEFGPIITHNYTIRNNGPSTVLNISTSLIWTAETFSGDVLLYLIDQPEVSSGKIQCESANANYLGFKENRKSKHGSKEQSKYTRSAADLSANEFDNDKKFKITSRNHFNSLRNEDMFNNDDYLDNLEFEDTWDKDNIRHLTKRRIEEDESNDRHIRQITNELPLENNVKENDKSAFSNEALCKNAQCVNLVCHVGPLKKDEEVSLAARYRVNVKAFKKVAESETFKVSTKLLALVTAQPFIGRPTERVMSTCEIETLILPVVNVHQPEPIPLWIIILSAVIGTTILLLLVLLLYKCGFFKRNRPTPGPERQPLNRSD